MQQHPSTAKNQTKQHFAFAQGQNDSPSKVNYDHYDQQEEQRMSHQSHQLRQSKTSTKSGTAKTSSSQVMGENIKSYTSNKQYSG
jgi:hypothetical protein